MDEFRIKVDASESTNKVSGDASGCAGFGLLILAVAVIIAAMAATTAYECGHLCGDDEQCWEECN